MRELWRVIAESKRVANEPTTQAGVTPFGLETNRPYMEVAIDYFFRTGMIPKRYKVDELFNDVTATLSLILTRACPP